MWSLSQLVNFVIPHIDCVPIKLNLLEESGWHSHSLLTPDLVARASVDEAGLTDALQGFTLSMARDVPIPQLSSLFQKPSNGQEH